LEVVMKAIGGFLLGAIALALVGGLCLAASILDREMVHAQEHVVSGDYAEPLAILETTERYFEYASRLPWIGNGPVNDMRARKAALHYWQRQYAAVVPEVADPVGNIPSDNIELQLVVASAMYRIGQAEAGSRQTMRGALDAAIEGYLTVLKNASRQEDAAYNYEFLLRLRDDIAKGRRKAESIDVSGPHGQVGGPLLKGKNEFKIYIPLQSDEIDKGVTAGKAAPIKRKG
jgi:hypothetical protein